MHVLGPGFYVEMDIETDELVYWLKVATVGVIGVVTIQTAYKLYANLRHEKGRSRWKEFLAAIGFIPPLIPTALSSGPLSIPLDSKHPLNHNVARFRFLLPQPDQVLGLRPGQHISIAATVGGKRVVRMYSPVSGNEARGYFDLIIKRYEGEHALSKHIHAMKEGDKLECDGPRGHIVYKGRGTFVIGRSKKREKRTFHHLTAIAGGSGITPLLQILKSSLEDYSDCCSLHLVFANSSDKDVFLREELDALAETHSTRFRLTYTVSKAGDGWRGCVGRPDSSVVFKLIPRPSDDHVVMICGPNPMVKSVVNGLKEMGHQERNVLVF
ncbi:hypothetical protein PMAYCL1PPCAC_07397 [Pristionchus mayeri]|uniref:NADH-cytochrome b5 reductase n=1 Tax=Pristionchus mayeri TaxID=1317129 RepID=A0AAN5CBL6_9BILA|nr:hypothetical protein PMAYCL1PPCAC_07397 [Pristionchus mayeri]